MLSIAYPFKGKHLEKSQRFSAPRLIIPLSQNLGRQSKVIVKKGDTVTAGQVIAERDGKISAFLHAPCSGKVIDIKPYNHPGLKKNTAVIIQEDPAVPVVPVTAFSDKISITPEEAVRCIDEKGIVGMGGAAFPTSVKLAPPKPIDTLVINGCECEPYLQSDYVLLLEKAYEVLKGIELIHTVLGSRKIIIGVEDNKRKAVMHLRQIIQEKFHSLPVEVVPLPTAYPQGGEKQLIYSLLKRKVPAGGLPFEIGVVVQNVATCFAVYEAVYAKKPLTERLVTFSGDALVEPKVLWVRIGTVLKDLFDANILAFKHDPESIVFGGPMMGITVDSLEYPVLKSTSGVLFFAKARIDQETTCIRCARCVDTCPMQLLPLEYVKSAKIQDARRAESYYVADCIECGSCSYACPAKIPIVHYIKAHKDQLAKKK